MSGAYIELPVVTAEAVMTVTDDDMRDLLVAVAGAIVFNIGANALQYFDGSAWQSIGTV